MDIQVNKKNNVFNLVINKDLILENEANLSTVVKKIEKFLKMYYLKEEEKGMFGGLMDNFK